MVTEKTMNLHRSSSLEQVEHYTALCWFLLLSHAGTSIPFEALEFIDIR